MTDSREVRWFREFAEELGEVPLSETFYGVSLKSPSNREVQAWTPHDAGWWFNVATLRRGEYLQVWLDRYLDRDRDAHLAVWISGSSARISEVAARLPRPPMGPYGDEQRDEQGFLVESVARDERARIGGYFIDDWGQRSWLGGYVRESPHLRPPHVAVGPAVAALRRLAELALGQRVIETLPDETDTYFETVTRIARPEQQALRAALLREQGPRCMISGCDVPIALDAAHIRPVAERGRSDVDNGLLLRADLHRLFDAGLITIVTEGVAMLAIADSLTMTAYADLVGTKVVGLRIGQREALNRRNARWSVGGLDAR